MYFIRDIALRLLRRNCNNLKQLTIYCCCGVSRFDSNLHVCAPFTKLHHSGKQSQNCRSNVHRWSIVRTNPSDLYHNYQSIHEILTLKSHHTNYKYDSLNMWRNGLVIYMTGTIYLLNSFDYTQLSCTMLSCLWPGFSDGYRFDKFNGTLLCFK